MSGTDSVPDAWVRFDGDLVAARGIGDDWTEGLPADATVTDARAGVLVPGFIDLHCHGGRRRPRSTTATAGIAATLAVHRVHGTTRSVLSLVTASIDDLAARLDGDRRASRRATRSCSDRTSRGPSSTPDSAAPTTPRCCAPPTPTRSTRLLDAAGGTLRQMTLAPEHDGASDAIRTVIDAGVAVAVGHTGADFETALRGVRRGCVDPHACVQRHARHPPSGARPGASRRCTPTT